MSKVEVTYKCRRVVLSYKPVYLGISKLTLQFSYLHVPCTALFTACFHAVISMYPFIKITPESKRC